MSMSPQFLLRLDLAPKPALAFGPILASGHVCKLDRRAVLIVALSAFAS